jgi:cobyrinic acid a,c-diamide synthase
MTQACDLAALEQMARAAPPLAALRWNPEPKSPPSGGTVAVAAGPVFTFCYEENLELLRARGADVAFFDPAADEALPAGAGAVLIGGGFPEVHTETLASNEPMRAAIRAFAEAGRPLVAECGGLLYLCRSLDGRPMCGVIDAHASMGNRLTLGYRSATAASPSAIAQPGFSVRGHEFHYSTVTPLSGEAAAWSFWAGSREGFVDRGVHASYLHTHWAAFPEIADRLVGVSARALESLPPWR